MTEIILHCNHGRIATADKEVEMHSHELVALNDPKAGEIKQQRRPFRPT